jgi:hypothetical protein
MSFLGSEFGTSACDEAGKPEMQIPVRLPLDFRLFSLALLCIEFL